MNELALFNDFFNDFDDDRYLLPSFSLKKSFPKVDVKEGKDAYTLHMDLPGKNEKDVKVELKHNVLTISSVEETETKDEDKDDKKNAKKDNEKYLVRERTYSRFERSFTLPSDVNGDDISAKVKDGVLTVTMPRRALAETKNIAITSD